MGKILVSSCRARRTGPHSAKKSSIGLFLFCRETTEHPHAAADNRLKIPSTRQNPTFCAQKSKTFALKMKFDSVLGIFESLFSRFLDFFFCHRRLSSPTPVTIIMWIFYHQKARVSIYIKFNCTSTSRSRVTRPGQVISTS